MERGQYPNWYDIWGLDSEPSVETKEQIEQTDALHADVEAGRAEVVERWDVVPTDEPPA